MKRHAAVATFVTLVVALAVASAILQKSATVEAAAVTAPRFEVDPMWPKPMPNHWVLGWVTGVTVDARDHVWIVHQANKLTPGEQFGDKNVPGSCCFAAPPVLEFDQAGNLVGHWGGPGPGYDWLDSPHGINLDYKDNVWIAGNGKGASQILKFTRAGKFLLQIGRPNQKQDSNDTQNVNMATDVVVDPAANEAYVSDGYGNRRVIVYDADSGNTNGTGAPTVTNPTTPTLVPMIRMRRWRNSSVRSCIVWKCRPTGWCMSAIAQTIGSRSSRRTARS